MVAAQATVKTTDRTGTLKKLLDDIGAMEVYVGIPEDRAPRKGEGEISNAQLMYIHTHGSPVRNIPPRPVIEPAIEAQGNKGPIADELAKAAKEVLNGNPSEAVRHLEKAGMTGMNSARAWFEDPRNNWAPNTRATALHKLRKLKGRARKEALAKLAGGSVPEGVSRPLVDTGELRKSITYVVKNGD